MALSGPHIIDGRYAIYDEIASGGMATVHYGCSLGAGSFSRVVAIKALHAHLAKESEFVAMFKDEARVAARIRHPNVTPTLDVVTTERDIFIVMEYVHGESLSKLFSAMRARREPMPLPIAAAIMVGLLGGLNAAHEATDERGQSLRIVHRDVSPQNLILGTDGVVRIVDFGIAKAVGRLQQTQTGEIKGKFGYMAPEQVNGLPVTRAADIYAAGVVLWEMLTGTPLYRAESDVAIAAQVLLGRINAPSSVVTGVPLLFDDVAMRALDRDAMRRFSTAREMARALETGTRIASPSEVAAWVDGLAGPTLRRREQRLVEIERDWAYRTGVPVRPHSAPPDTRDESAHAMTTQGGLEPLSLMDTHDRTNPTRDRRARQVGVWAALAAGALIAAAGLFDRRDDVAGWLRPASPASAAPATSPMPSTPRAAAPLSPPVATVAPSVKVPVTVPVESLPVAVPSSVSIDALPRAVEPPAPSSLPARRSGGRRH
jgi:serine/threonine-protein kinase